MQPVLNIDTSMSLDSQPSSQLGLLPARASKLTQDSPGRSAKGLGFSPMHRHGPVNTDCRVMQNMLAPRWPCQMCQLHQKHDNNPPAHMGAWIAMVSLTKNEERKLILNNAAG